MKAKISILLAAVLFAMMMAVGCDAQINPTVKVDETVAADTAKTEPETEAPTENPLSEKTAEDYVSTAREYTASYRSGMILAGGNSNDSETTLCRLPQISTELKASAKINQEIHDSYDATFDEYLTLDGQFIPVNWIDYRCYLNGSVLSLIIESRTTNTPNSFFTVYNLDVLTGERIGKNELVGRSDVSADEADALLCAEIEKKYSDIQGDWITPEMIENAKSTSLSAENINDAGMYYNEDGKLCAAYRYVWFAGAANYGDICVLEASILA